MALLSIIIPVYKVEQYLPQCLDSIVTGIKGEGIEVLVIDDGSPDRSGEIADAYAVKYPYIKVVHKNNAGVAAARNTGIEAAQGEWLYFADSDDWLAEGAIDIFQKRIRENPDADILLMDAWKNIKDKELPWEHFSREFILDSRQKIRALQRGVLYFPSTGIATHIPLAAPWDKVYRKRFITEKNIHFQVKLKVLDDMVFNMEALGKADKVVYCRDKIYHYRFVPESITNSYSPDRVAQDGKVWEYIQNYMAESFKQDEWSAEEKHKFVQAYYYRVIKSFSICCRLSFFNRRNKKSFRKKIEYVKDVLGMEPYCTAFQHASLRGAEWRLKAVICLGRHKLGIGIYLLHMAQSCLN